MGICCRPLLCRSLSLAILVLLLTGGCSSENVANQVASMNDAHIKQLANLYYAYQRSHGWQGPKDEAVLKQFVKTDMDPNKLALMKIDPSKIDDIFISQRDQKPFKIKFSAGGGPGANVPVVFEASGVDGKRQVGFTGPMVHDVDSSQYDALWSGKTPANVTNTGAASADAGTKK
jgi:uncharacterized protein YceK